jgi:Asp-tRNA(Asn)/Glu-tRNA(Gln) amidotransferase A subunit family amidase
MSRDELAWRPALELAAAIRRKEVSPVEVTEAILGRIERLNPQLNAFCLVSHEVARAAAREAEIGIMRGEPAGPLQGVPISIKDVLFTRGIPTTAGSRMFEDVVPTEDSVPVARLRAAGAVVLGKTNTSELGHKALTTNPLFGATRNPWNPSVTPGGSSGGAAAAVAAGLGPVALGTDGGGSIRIPAACCDLYGFKPSFGRVPNHPAFPGWERFAQAGPLTRTVRDAALVLDVIAGQDDRDLDSLPASPDAFLGACSGDIQGFHVAWAPDLGFTRVDREVLALCEEAAGQFESLGCHVEVVNPAWGSPEEAFGTVVSAQFHAAWADRLPQDEALMDATLVKFIRRGGAVTVRQYVDALAWTRSFWLDVHAFLERFDLLLTPTLAVPPFGGDGPPPREIAGERVSVLGWMPFTYPFNMTGQPAASVPAGFTPAGLPVGLQIVGRRHADRSVLAASAAYESACPWTGRYPPVG